MWSDLTEDERGLHCRPASMAGVRASTPIHHERNKMREKRLMTTTTHIWRLDDGNRSSGGDKRRRRQVVAMVVGQAVAAVWG